MYIYIYDQSTEKSSPRLPPTLAGSLMGYVCMAALVLFQARFLPTQVVEGSLLRGNPCRVPDACPGTTAMPSVGLGSVYVS